MIIEELVAAKFFAMYGAVFAGGWATLHGLFGTTGFAGVFGWLFFAVAAFSTVVMVYRGTAVVLSRVPARHLFLTQVTLSAVVPAVPVMLLWNSAVSLERVYGYLVGHAWILISALALAFYARVFSININPVFPVRFAYWVTGLAAGVAFFMAYFSSKTGGQVFLLGGVPEKATVADLRLLYYVVTLAAASAGVLWGFHRGNVRWRGRR